MKMLKKMAAVALAAVMALMMLTACGGGNSTELDFDKDVVGNQAKQAEVLQALNTVRENGGHKAVVENAEATAIAKKYATLIVWENAGIISESEYLARWQQVRQLGINGQKPTGFAAINRMMTQRDFEYWSGRDTTENDKVYAALADSYAALADSEGVTIAGVSVVELNGEIATVVLAYK